MSALQQQIDFALRDGIITTVKHQHILANPHAIAREYNINPFFLFKKSTDVLENVHIDFVRTIRKMQSEHKGAYAINAGSLTEHFQMMTAILLRNKIEAWYYTVEDLLHFLELDYENKYTFSNHILFIPNVQNIRDGDAQMKFIYFLNFAIDHGVFVVLHFINKSAIPQSLNDYWYKVITDTFYCIENTTTGVL